MYGALYYGGFYLGQAAQYPLLAESRTNLGGTYGSATYGQYYYGGHIHGQPALPEPYWVGGTHGSAGYATMYYSGHIQPGVAPPIPPAPIHGSVGGIGARGRRLIADLPTYYQPSNELTELSLKARFERAEAEHLDEEDLFLILSLWMSIK